MDEMRAHLSMLMDSIPSKEKQNDEDDDTESCSSQRFKKRNICKLYLTGLCPHDLFANTKHYLGPCDKEHSDELKDLYMKCREKKRYHYEEEAIRLIQPLVDDSDRKISRGQIRCDDDDKKEPDEGKDEEIKRIEAQLEETMKRAEQLGNEGNVDESMRLMEECEMLNKEKQKYQEKLQENDSVYNQKLKPCDICGALLSATDSDRRLSEHFSGKIHIGFQMLRNALKELHEYLREYKALDNQHESTKGGRNRSVDRDSSSNKNRGERDGHRRHHQSRRRDHLNDLSPHGRDSRHHRKIELHRTSANYAPSSSKYRADEGASRSRMRSRYYVEPDSRSKNGDHGRSYGIGSRSERYSRESGRSSDRHRRDHRDGKSRYAHHERIDGDGSSEERYRSRSNREDKRKSYNSMDVERKKRRQYSDDETWRDASEGDDWKVDHVNHGGTGKPGKEIVT